MDGIPYVRSSRPHPQLVAGVMRIKFEVSFVFPVEYGARFSEKYIRNALKHWGGQFEPPGADWNYPEGHPFFFGPKHLKIKRIK